MRDPPYDYRNAGTLLAIAGLLNAVFAFVFVIMFLMFLVGFLWIVPFFFGLVEILIGISMAQGQPKPSSPWVAGLGILASICNCNLFSLVLEIVALQKLRQPEVRNWLEVADG